MGTLVKPERAQPLFHKHTHSHTKGASAQLRVGHHPVGSKKVRKQV